MEGDQEVRSLRRGLQALTVINQHESMSIARLADAMGLPRTTAERLLNTLTAEGYLVRSMVDKLYRLTPKVLGLASGYSGEAWIGHVAAPLLNQTTEAIGWPLAIAVADNADMRVRYTTDGMTSLWLNRRQVGATIPIPRASSGMVHLACCAPREAAELTALVEQTYPTLPLDPERVAAARRDGYAFSPNPTREQSISVPILCDGRCVGVLLMIFMARVHTHEQVVDQYLPRLLALSQQISEKTALGACPPVTDGTD